MDSVLETQVLLVYNSSGIVKKTIFLTDKNFEELEKTSLYELYHYYKKNRNEIFNNSEIDFYKGHILLTFNLLEAKNYIANSILKTNKKILLFSLFGNFDYYNNDETVFSPFNINKLYSKNNENTILYEANPEIVTNNFFCVLEDGFLGDFYNEPIKKLEEFVNKLFETVENNKDKDLKIWLENNIIDTYDLRDLENYLYDVSLLSGVHKNIIKYFYDKTLISGDNFYYKEIEDSNSKNKPKNLIEVFSKKDNKPIFSSVDNLIKIYDGIAFTKLLSDVRIDKYFSKKKKVKSHTTIFYNVFFKEMLFIDFDTDFFLENTLKTKNIFVDRTRKINIMLSSDHIIYATFLYNSAILKYLTQIIIIIQIGNDNVEFVKKDKKFGNRYLSRYCQGSRSPVDINIEEGKKIIREGNFENYMNIFYKEKNDLGDIYFDSETEIFSVCAEKDKSHIGFISEIYEGYNLCVPCCYKKNKTDNKIFKECVLKNDKDNSFIIDNFVNIFKQYRVIIKPGKIGFLIGKLEKLFNKDSANFLHKNKIVQKITKDSWSDKQSLMEKKNSLKKMGIYRYNNTNIFLSKNSDDDVFYSYNDKTNENDYTYSLKNDLKLQKEKINIKSNSIKKNKNFSVIYESLSEDESFVLLNNQNRLELVKNYVVYFNYKENFDFIGVENLEEEDSVRIYIIDDVLFFNKKTYDLYIQYPDEFYSIVEIILVIQKKNHVLKIINKTTFNSEIFIEDLSVNKKKIVLDELLKSINNLQFIEDDEEIVYTENYTEIENEKFYYLNSRNTNYFFEIKNFLFIPDSLAYYLTDILYKNLFVGFENENEKLENKKIFLNNLDNLINMKINFNLSYKKYPEFIEETKKYVNE